MRDSVSAELDIRANTWISYGSSIEHNRQQAIDLLLHDDEPQGVTESMTLLKKFKGRGSACRSWQLVLDLC